MKSPYSQTDKTTAYLNKQYAKLFRSVASFDELNVIPASHEIYNRIYTLVEQEAARLSKAVYKKYKHEENEEPFDALAFVLAMLLGYNPVTKYIFKNELDRKRARFAESLIASETPHEELGRALRQVSGMSAQFMDDVTFETLVQVFRDNGVERVRWVTSPDDRRCKQCASMHNRIYSINDIPAKPHIHCRCWIEEVT